MPRARIFRIHRDRPQPRDLAQVAAIVRDGGLALIPTDTMYALVGMPGNREVIERMRKIKHLVSLKYLTLLCRSLSEASHYAVIDDKVFKLIRQLAPGPFTFLLNASKEVNRAALAPKRREVGLRIPDHAIAQGLLAELDGTLIATSARLPDGEPATYHYELIDMFGAHVDAVIDDESDMLEEKPSTMLDMTGPAFRVVREGAGIEELAKFMIPGEIEAK